MVWWGGVVGCEGWGVRECGGDGVVGWCGGMRERGG